MKHFLCVDLPFLDLVSQTPRPRGRGRPLFAELLDRPKRILKTLRFQHASQNASGSASRFIPLFTSGLSARAFLARNPKRCLILKGKKPVSFLQIAPRCVLKTRVLGARQKGDSKWEKPVSAKICGFLRFPAKICGFLWFSAQICDSQSPSFTERAENQRKSAKICENVRSGSGFSLLLSPFWRALMFRNAHFRF